MKNSEESYYKTRSSKPRTDVSRAVRFIYLTTLSFNGIYRVNRKGEFNVPYGYKTHLATCNESHLRQCSKLLSSTTLLAADFEKAVDSATSGDLVYFDPPYTVAHGNNGFLKYNEKILQWEDQERLAKLANSLAERGCKVVISNADHYSVNFLYRDFVTKRIFRPSVIAASSEHRRLITECIFHN